MEGEDFTTSRLPTLARVLIMIGPLALISGCLFPPADTVPGPTATPAATTAAPTDTPPAGASVTPAGGGGGGGDNSTGRASEAVVQIKGHGLRLDQGAECSLVNGVQVSLASKDGLDALDATVTTTGVGSLILTVDHIIWQPQQTTLFQVSGSHATWQGTMLSDEGEEADVAIDIDCAT